jgi:hypothetical protein
MIGPNDLQKDAGRHGEAAVFGRGARENDGTAVGRCGGFLSHQGSFLSVSLVCTV